MRPPAGAVIVFFLAFGLYLWTMPPTLAPYRDAGEMTSSTATLGVSHPPSYPVYVMLGRLSSILPLGSHAFRLNLLSALAGAAALSALWLALLDLGAASAGAACILLAANSTFWNVCGVQEMYSLTLLFAAILLLIALRLKARPEPRLWLAFCLLCGLFLGNRTDLLLWAPGLLLLGLPPAIKRDMRLAALSCGFVLLGLLVYLYLPLRSRQGPWLDWNHPADLYNFIGSLTRRGSGGTLDLISKSYAPGEMFLPNLKVYAGHLWSNFGPALLLAVLGFYRTMKANPKRCAAFSLLYLASGPIFLFLANMPPNPHALAIVEPHYLLSDVILAVWAAESIALGAPSLLSAGLRPAAIAAALALMPWLFGRWNQMDRRWNLIGYDYVHNVMRSIPPGSIVIAKKDVQIFSLWHFHRVEGLRPDVRVAAQGISHSPWYHGSAAKWETGTGVPLRTGPLKDSADFKKFIAANSGPVFGTTDVEFPQGLALGTPRGLVVPLSQGSASEGADPAIWEFLVRRGDYCYDRRPDFFTSDLVEAYALSLQRLGGALIEAGQASQARRLLMSAWSMKWLLPEVPVFLGFQAYKKGDLAVAAAYYEDASAGYDGLIELTKEYYSLPTVADAIRSSAAEALLNLGVIYERLKKPAEAESTYRKALGLNPRIPKAHYNLAVLYWNKDWVRVVEELRAALSIDPNFPDALRYMPMAEAGQRASQNPKP
ncbi:MAG: DUF2723 domain-containing protein [Elusimicrobia bacterium]|nr:DUF2723 domain-containing protein [Elusimicrobiota bacterium]